MTFLVLLCGGCDGQPRELETIGLPVAVAGDLGGQDEDASPDGNTGLASSQIADAGREPSAPTPGPEPEKALAMAKRGDSLGKRGDFVGAAKAYEQAVALDDQTAWLRTTWAWYLARSDQVAAARDELEKAMAMSSRRGPLLSAAIHHALGEIHELRGDRVRAEDNYRRALRIRAEPPLALAMLSVMPLQASHRSEVERLAFHGIGQDQWPAGVSPQSFVKEGSSARVLALASLGDRALAVVAEPADAVDGLAGSFGYRAAFLPEGAGQGDGGVAEQIKVPLLDARPVRWHHAKVALAPLGPHRPGLLVTVTTHSPAAGAPATATTHLLGLKGSQLVSLFSERTRHEKERPMGCRRGYRSRVMLEDGNGDQVMDRVVVSRRDYVEKRARKLSKELCEPLSRTQPAKITPLAVPTVGVADAAAPRADGGLKGN